MGLRKIILLASVLFASAIQAQDLTIHVDKKGKVGFVDNSGKIVVKCEYESATPFENGYSIVTKSQKSGVIDQTGKVVLPLKYRLSCHGPRTFTCLMPVRRKGWPRILAR